VKRAIVEMQVTCDRCSRTEERRQVGASEPVKVYAAKSRLSYAAAKRHYPPSGYFVRTSSIVYEEHGRSYGESELHPDSGTVTEDAFEFIEPGWSAENDKDYCPICTEHIAAAHQSAAATIAAAYAKVTP
jgi:hypothetical protein